MHYDGVCPFGVRTVPGHASVHRHGACFPVQVALVVVGEVRHITGVLWLHEHGPLLAQNVTGESGSRVANQIFSEKLSRRRRRWVGGYVAVLSSLCIRDVFHQARSRVVPTVTCHRWDPRLVGHMAWVFQRNLFQDLRIHILEIVSEWKTNLHCTTGCSWKYNRQDL